MVEKLGPRPEQRTYIGRLTEFEKGTDEKVTLINPGPFRVINNMMENFVSS
jgi:hypothetical protein